MLQREGSELVEGPELTWYPNDIISERTMQLPSMSKVRLEDTILPM